MPSNKIVSYVRNCQLKGKEGDAMFHIEGDHIYPTLDGYAIIPVEDYNRLRQLEIGTKTKEKNAAS